MEQGPVRISLDSLGMTLSNILPRFMIDKGEVEAFRKDAPESLQKSFVFVSENGGEESGSIVVLGKSSLEEIQAQSLVDFELIQQKSMAMDYKSIISSLTPPEVEQKLEEVLQENLRLKETLEQNNISMKEHLNILVTRQEELSKVHEAHRLKFAETKNLVNLLKAENSELKAKVDSNEKQHSERSTQTEKGEKAPNPDQSSQTEQEEKAPKPDQSSQTGKEEEEPSKPDISEQSLENVRSTEMMRMAAKSEQQGQEIAHLNRIIASLKQQLESLYQEPFASIRLEDVQSSPQQSSDFSRQQFLASFTRYSKKLQTLGDCYAAQTSRYTSIQECLQRCSDLLTDRRDDAAGTEDSRQSVESDKRKELQMHRGKLIDEELRTIAERQEMIRAQSEFQKIFTDYNSTLLELESLRKESERMSTLQRGVSLRDERLDEARMNLKESERLLDEQRRGVEQDRQKLADELQAIERERLHLREEHCLLVNANNTLNKQEREFVEANAALNDEASSIRESNEVLREQLKVYEEQFEEQIKLRQTILSERDELIDHVRKLEEEKSRNMSAMRMHGVVRRSPMDPH